MTADTGYTVVIVGGLGFLVVGLGFAIYKGWRDDKEGKK